MAAADGSSVTGPEPVTPPAVPDPNVDPVAAAQLTGKNDDVPTADGVDVTNLDPQQYTQWYGDKLKAQGIDVPDATITVQTPKATGTTSGAKAGAGANVMDAAQDFMGQHMENGANGCVEAVTKIGARYNPFFADELSKGVVNVDTLVSDAGDKVIPFDPNNLEAGDVIVYGDNLNDISMFEIADTAIAVDNALPAAKEAADAVIGLNTTDAVARSMAAIYRGSAD